MKGPQYSSDKSLPGRTAEPDLSAHAYSALLQLARALGRLAAAEDLKVSAALDTTVATDGETTRPSNDCGR